MFIVLVAVLVLAFYRGWLSVNKERFWIDYDGVKLKFVKYLP